MVTKSQEQKSSSKKSALAGRMVTQEELTGVPPLTQRSKDEESALDSEKRSQEIS